MYFCKFALRYEINLVNRIMKYKTVSFGLILFVVLSVFLQLTNEYHFFYLDQFQLFQLTGDYIAGKLFQPGGLALLVGEFLTQFYILPYAGALIVAALLAGIGILTHVIVRHIAVASGGNMRSSISGEVMLPEWYALYLLPVLSLLLIHFYFNYLLMGTVAYLMLLASLVLYSYCSVFGSYRLIACILLIPLLYWWGGAVAGLLAVCIAIKEILDRARLRYWVVLVAIAEFLALAFGSLHATILSESRFAFLPDSYYNPLLLSPAVIYLSWGILPVIIFVAYQLRKRRFRPKRIVAAFVFYTAQFVAIALLAWWLIPRHLDSKSDRLMELDYFARNRQWDKIIESCNGPMDNFLYLGYLNTALAEKGELADRLFFFDQHGTKGILSEWDETFAVSCMLSDVYFAFGDIALSQRMAFVCTQMVIGESNPRSLQRLVQTNLIFGQYAVAERYIRLLENTIGYKSWSTAHRRFLYNDEAVESDPLLGAKRRFLPRESTLAQLNGVAEDLVYRIENIPEDRLPIQLLGSIYLLAKDMESFRKMVETYYGSPALPVLPHSFQEAVILLNDKDRAYWERFNVSENVIRSFAGYSDIVLRNRNNPQLVFNLLSNSYNNTYWYYYIYK